MFSLPSSVMTQFSCHLPRRLLLLGRLKHPYPSFPHPCTRKCFEKWVKFTLFREYTFLLWKSLNFYKERNHSIGVPLWHSGLGIWHCHCSSSGGCYGMGSNPGLGGSTCCRCGPPKKIERNNSTINGYMSITEKPFREKGTHSNLL